MFALPFILPSSLSFRLLARSCNTSWVPGLNHLVLRHPTRLFLLNLNYSVLSCVFLPSTHSTWQNHCNHFLYNSIHNFFLNSDIFSRSCLSNSVLACFSVHYLQNLHVHFMHFSKAFLFVNLHVSASCSLDKFPKGSAMIRQRRPLPRESLLLVRLENLISQRWL